MGLEKGLVAREWAGQGIAVGGFWDWGWGIVRYILAEEGEESVMESGEMGVLP